jgi:NADPH-dependent F420 reductase
MDIALLGGTGDIGEGLALRWADDTNHTVSIGSREADKAATKASEYETELESRGREVTIEGLANEDAAARADAVVTAVNRGGDTDTVGAVAGAVAGARFGADALPARWLQTVDYRQDLELLARALATTDIEPPA